MLEQILVVTFTRAATSDLKMRIRANLQAAVNFCKAALQGVSRGTSPPDYLQAVFEQGSASIFLACQRLEQALIFFDQAQIFTIHGFCQRMLKEFLFEGHFPINQRELPSREIY